jgi:hypothetical protein
MRPLSRIQPQGPVVAYQTYALYAPRQTHHKRVSCAEAGCPEQAHGWVSLIDERTDRGAAQAHYIRRDSGRRFREERTRDGLTRFVFPPGQRCFRQHWRRNDREALCVVRGGDWRHNLGVIRDHGTRADLWVEDFAEHQDRLIAAAGAGGEP